MTDLSPAALAVLTAATQKLYCLDPEDVPMSASEYGSAIAAALRAAADQLGYSNVPKEFAYMRPKVIDVDDLLAIADELEGVKYGTYRCELKQQ